MFIASNLAAPSSPHIVFESYCYPRILSRFSIVTFRILPSGSASLLNVKLSDALDATLFATVGHEDQYGTSAESIYETATLKGYGGEYDYSRSGHPTRTRLGAHFFNYYCLSHFSAEYHIAKISSAQHAFVVLSGIAALDVIMRLLKPGDHLIAGDDVYDGTNRLFNYLQSHTGLVVHHVDTADPASIHPHLLPGKTALVLLESPTKIADIDAIARHRTRR
jgi:cystathionine beta-lyase/cystathionine gamma-synthase